MDGPQAFYQTDPAQSTMELHVNTFTASDDTKLYYKDKAQLNYDLLDFARP